MGIDFQRDRWRRVTKPLRYRDNVNACVDKLRCVSVSQSVQRNVCEANSIRGIAPFRTQGIGGLRRTIKPRKDQSIIWQLAKAQRHALLKLLTAMLAKQV